jgi:hypothetical protein
MCFESFAKPGCGKTSCVRLVGVRVLDGVRRVGSVRNTVLPACAVGGGKTVREAPTSEPWHPAGWKPAAPFPFTGRMPVFRAGAPPDCIVTAQFGSSGRSASAQTA